MHFPDMNFTVIVPTKDRYVDLGNLLKSFAPQDIKPLCIIVVDCTKDMPMPDDVKALFEKWQVEHILTDAVGIPAQRNIGLEVCPPQTDIVCFFDDDATLEPDFFAKLQRAYLADEDEAIGGMAGFPLFNNGIHFEKNPPDAELTIPGDTLYGCCMTFRWNVIETMRFDENLKLYAWLEDWDFAYRVMQQKRICVCLHAYFYHHQSPSGRINHKRMGFAQIANRAYLYRKNKVATTRRKEFSFYAYTMAANLARLHKKGRLKRWWGNLLALWHVVLRQKNPSIITQL